MIGNKENENGERIIEVCFGKDEEKLNFYKENQEGKYYLAHNNGEIIRYGDNEYKIQYQYRRGKRPYLNIKIGRKEYIVEGRLIK